MNNLAQRLANGEPAAFAELYDACADRLYRYLVATLAAHDKAADVLQESFVRLAKSRQRLVSIDDPVAYLFAIARNEARRHLTRHRRNGRQSAADEMTQVPFHTPRELGDREIATVVAEAIDRLPDEQREVVKLKTYGGLTFREMAAATGVPQGTIATRYRAALNQLRQWLAKETL